MYRPITIHIHWVDANHHWGYGAALNLILCWEYQQLRWYDPVAGCYLDTFDGEAASRIAAEARVRELEAEIRRLRNPRA